MRKVWDGMISVFPKPTGALEDRSRVAERLSSRAFLSCLMVMGVFLFVNKEVFIFCSGR